MKHILYSFLTTFFIVFVNINVISAQQVNPKIQEVYGDKTQEIAQNDPERIKALNDLLDNRIKIVISPVVGEDKYTKLSSVPLLNKYNPNLKRDEQFDPENFNALKYNMNFFTTQTQVYRVDNTDFIIVIEKQRTKN
jgi:hypothetical protein